MSKEFCDYIEDMLIKGDCFDKQENTLHEIEQHLKNKGKHIDYRKLCMVFMQRSSDCRVDSMRAFSAVERSLNIEEARYKLSQLSTIKITETVENKKDQGISKMEQYYKDMREGKRSPHCRRDVTTEAILDLRDQGYTYDQISNITGLSRSTVSTRLRKWRKSQGL